MVKALALAAVVGMAVVGAARAEGPEDAASSEARQGGPGGPGGTVGAEEEGKVLAFLKENAPDMARHLDMARREKPEEYRHHLSELAKMVRNPDMREVFVKNYAAETKVRKLVEAARRAEGAEKDRLSKDLEAALSDQFDAKLAQQELQVKKMQEEIGKLKARIESRRGRKAQLVKKRLAEMTGDGDGWD